MSELIVPELRRDPFREHYRRLILGSLLHEAETRSEHERESGHRMRAARAERDVALLRAATGVAGETAPLPRFGRELRSSIRMIWLATLALLAVDVVVFGVEAWTTTVADIGLIVLTVVWFWVCAEDLLVPREPEPAQLKLLS